MRMLSAHGTLALLTLACTCIYLAFPKLIKSRWFSRSYALCQADPVSSHTHPLYPFYLLLITAFRLVSLTPSRGPFMPSLGGGVSCQGHHCSPGRGRHQSGSARLCSRHCQPERCCRVSVAPACLYSETLDHGRKLAKAVMLEQVVQSTKSRG